MSDDKMMAKIQALLNQANHESTSDAEKEAFLGKADELMFRHKIDEIMLASRWSAAEKVRNAAPDPIHDKIEWVPRYDPFWDIHSDVVLAMSDLSGVRLVFLSDQLSIFGYPADVQYFKMLWLTSYLTFSAKMDPKWDINLSQGENIRTFLEAGIKWLPVWYKAEQAGRPLKRKDGSVVPPPPDDNGWMKREYVKACAAANEQPLKLHFGTQNYRLSYAQGFAQTISARCYRLKLAREEISRGAHGAALVLLTEADAIEDLIRDTYPHLKYGSAGRRRKSGGVEVGAARGRSAGDSVDMSGGAGGVGQGSASPSVGTGPRAIGS